MRTSLPLSEIYLYLSQSPINLLVADPVAIPIVHGHADRAYQEVPGVPGDPLPPRPHELPERHLVPYPRVEMKYLHVPPDTLGRDELELPLAGLRHLRALLPEPLAYPPTARAEPAPVERGIVATLGDER